MDKNVKAGRSLLADHLLGARKTVRRLEAKDNAAEGRDLFTAGQLFEARYTLRGLRDLAAEFSGRPN